MRNRQETQWEGVVRNYNHISFVPAVGRGASAVPGAGDTVGLQGCLGRTPSDIQAVSSKVRRNSLDPPPSELYCPSVSPKLCLFTEHSAHPGHSSRRGSWR